MKFGFVTQYSEKIVEFASNAGFNCLEIFVGSDFNMGLDKINIDEIVEVFNNNNLKVGTISCVPNHLAGDLEYRKEKNQEFIQALKLCRKFGTNIVMTNAWADKSKTPSENIKIYKEVFSEYARVAEDEGVRIALENCPHALGYPMTIGNISYCPEMWDALFEAVPSTSIGLEFDPSHLYWLGINYVKAIRKYGEKIFAFHAKDTEIVKEQLDRYGILGKVFGKSSEWDAGWWRYRIPGWGMIDWKEIFKALNDTGFDGPMLIEHEDPVFDGDRREEGLKMGLRYLKQFTL